MQGLTIFLNGKKETINWLKISLDEATKKAKEKNKDILIYFTAKWCGPCHKMEDEVFTNHKVVRTVNDNYVAIKIDVDAWGGKKWKEEFSIKGMPEFFILNTKKQRLRHNLGAIPTKEFLEFLNLKERPSDLKILDTTHAAFRYEKWKSKISLTLGSGFSNLNNSNSKNILGYEINFGYNFEKKRLLFSTGINFASIGSSIVSLNYIKVPAQLSVNFYRGTLLGLPGGFRALASPYYGRLLNNPSLNVNKNDLGMDYGLGVYIGDASNASLEFSIKGSQGFTDILPQSGKQTNQFFRTSLSLAI